MLLSDFKIQLKYLRYHSANPQVTLGNQGES